MLHLLLDSAQIILEKDRIFWGKDADLFFPI